MTDRRTGQQKRSVNCEAQGDGTDVLSEKQPPTGNEH